MDVARAVVRVLADAGVEVAFTVPGESFLPILDALGDEPRIRAIATRHEGGAAFAAEAYAALTRRPTLALATRAVGAANLAIGLHTADQDSSPVVAIIGQVASSAKGREAFQEIDLERFLGAVTRSAVEPDSQGAMVTTAADLVRQAVSGRPGPVALITREDLLHGEVPDPDPGAVEPEAVASLDPSVVSLILDRLRAARRPVLLVGLDAVHGVDPARLADFVEAVAVPVVTTWRHPDAFSGEHPNAIGMAGLGRLPVVADALAEADYWLILGDRLDEITAAGYAVPAADVTVDHVWLEPADLVPQRDGVGMVASAADFIDAALVLSAGQSEPSRAAYVHARRRRFETESIPMPRAVAQGCVDQFALAAELRRLLPTGAVIVSDAGNFASWPARYLRWTEPRTFLGPVSGAMGYAVPACLGAALARPDRTVVGFVGDGGFLMTAAELQTAAREGIAFTVVVLDNGRYNTIRMHQERAYPGRPVATYLGTTDYVSLSRGLGASADLVTRLEDFEAAFRAALAHPGPSVVVVRIDPDQVSVADAD